MSPAQATPLLTIAGGILAALSLSGIPAHHNSGSPATVSAKLSEWKVELSERTAPSGPITFTIANVGTIPHAFEVEGQRIERKTSVIQPGSTASLTLALKPGTYDVYCPVGEDSHKKLGMDTRLTVLDQTKPASLHHGVTPSGTEGAPSMNVSPATAEPVQVIKVTGGGPVIQILPSPFPFPDSAAPILKQFGAEQEGLESQIKNGLYSDNVTPISGAFTITAWDKGSTRDSVDGTALFTTQDGTRWKLVLDRVQAKDVPHHPRFGGVILGLYYHGNTGVHTPLVPTINSAVALWAFGHLYRNDVLVTDNANVHVMLLSRTRRESDFALECWDCSKNAIDELQLQILPAPGEPKFDAPGGFLFVNWEKSASTRPATPG